MPVQSPFEQKAFKGTELLHVKMMPTATWGNKLRQFRFLFFFWLKRLGEQKLVYNWLQRSLLISCTRSLQSLSISQCIYIYIPSSAMPSAYCLPWALPTDREVWGSLCGGWGATDGKSKWNDQKLLIYSTKKETLKLLLLNEKQKQNTFHKDYTECCLCQIISLGF